MFKELFKMYNVKAIALVMVIGIGIGMVISSGYSNYTELRAYRQKYETLEQFGKYMTDTGVWDSYKLTIEEGE